MDREQMVEQRAKADYWLAWPEYEWARVPSHEQDRYRRIARAELEREGRLAGTLRDIASQTWPGSSLTAIAMSAAHTLAAYEAEFSPPTRTVEQIAADIAREWRDGRFSVQLRQSSEPVLLLDELAAALKKGGA